MTTEMTTEEKSYPQIPFEQFLIAREQLLFVRAKDRQRSFLRRGAWMLGGILLTAAHILWGGLWGGLLGLVKGIFQETPKRPEPESEDPFTDSDSLYYLHHNQQACEAMREGKVVFEYDPLKPF